MDDDDHAFFDDDYQSDKPVKKVEEEIAQFPIPLHGSSNEKNEIKKDNSKPKPYDKEDYDREVSTISTSPFQLSSSGGSDNDDDTLTDVSPRSSPEASPRMKRTFRYSFSEDEQDVEVNDRRKRKTKKEETVVLSSSSGSEEEEEKVVKKHITKLNVTYKSPVSSIAEDKNIKGDSSATSNRKHKKQHPSKLHKGQGDHNVSIDHIEGSLNRYFEKSSPPSAKAKNNDDETEQTRQEQRNLATHHQAGDAGVDLDEDSVDLNHLLKMILDLEEKGVNVKEKYNEQQKVRNKQFGQQQNNQQRQTNSARQNRKKNMSFSNLQAREIERENNRLFKEITSKRRPQSGSRPGSAMSVRSRQSTKSTRSNMSFRSSSSTMSTRSTRSLASTPGPPKLYHSAVNRINNQRQIERENMKILKRLQEAKPTSSLQRVNQLRDYQRQTRYMGSAPTPSSGNTRRKYHREQVVVNNQLDIGADESRFRQIRPAWQDVW